VEGPEERVLSVKKLLVKNAHVKKTPVVEEAEFV
jgi:hypothetical protein